LLADDEINVAGIMACRCGIAPPAGLPRGLSDEKCRWLGEQESCAGGGIEYLTTLEHTIIFHGSF